MIKEIETIKKSCHLIEEQSGEFVTRMTVSICEESGIFQVAFLSESNTPYELRENGDVLKLNNGDWKSIGEV